MATRASNEPQFRAAVEEITGRRVIGFMSGMDVEHDLASEVFVSSEYRPARLLPRALADERRTGAA